MTSWNLSSFPVCVFTDFIGRKAWRFPLDNAHKTQPASATLRGTEPYRWMVADKCCLCAGQRWDRCTAPQCKINRPAAK